jgi:transcriptional regulator with XRE-family HTH domain
MNKPYYTRALHIEKFAAYLKPIIDDMGGVAAFAARIGSDATSVRNWNNGKAIPRLTTLVKMSELLGLNLDELLEAAGKPPIEELRRHTARDASDSLPLMLSAWRTSTHSGDTLAASKEIGFDRWMLSRYISGSRVPHSVEHVYAMARVLKVTPADILLMTGITEADEIWAKVTGLAKAVRDGLESVGVDHFDKPKVEAAARELGMTPAKLWSYVEGVATPGIADCIKIAEFAPVSVRVILKAVGVSPSDALALAKAARNQQRRWKDHDLGDLLRSYRIAAELRQPEVAKALRCARTSVVRFESGQTIFPINKLVAFAKLTNAPLERLLTAAIAA